MMSMVLLLTSFTSVHAQPSKEMYIVQMNESYSETMNRIEEVVGGIEPELYMRIVSMGQLTGLRANKQNE